MTFSVSLQTQLSSVMDALAKAAVAQIGKLVAEDTAVLRLEISRSYRENEALRMKMRVMKSEMLALRIQRVHAPRGRRFFGTRVLCRPRSRDAESVTVPAHQSTEDHSHLSGHAHLSVAEKCAPPATEEESTEAVIDCPDLIVIKKEEPEDEQRERADPGGSSNILAHGGPEDKPAPSRTHSQSAGGPGGEPAPGNSQSRPFLSEGVAELVSPSPDGFAPSVGQQPRGFPSRGPPPAAVGARPSDGAGRAWSGGGGQLTCSLRGPPAGARTAHLRAAATAGSRRPPDPRAPPLVGGGGRGFRCGQCGKEFVNGTSLRVHLRIHTGEKPYVCAQCGRRFTQSGSLKIHLRTHSGEKPYHCTHCQARFNNPSNLRRHLLTHTYAHHGHSA